MNLNEDKTILRTLPRFSHHPATHTLTFLVMKLVKMFHFFLSLPAPLSAGGAPPPAVEAVV